MRRVRCIVVPVCSSSWHVAGCIFWQLDVQRSLWLMLQVERNFGAAWILGPVRTSGGHTIRNFLFVRQVLSSLYARQQASCRLG